MAIDYNIMGERIRKARLKKKLTQEDIANKLDVSVPFVSDIERGKSRINLTRLDQLSTILDVSEAYLLSGISNNSKNYLDEDFKNLLDSCTKEEQKSIYNIVKSIIENKNKGKLI